MNSPGNFTDTDTQLGIWCISDYYIPRTYAYRLQVLADRTAALLRHVNLLRTEDTVNLFHLEDFALANSYRFSLVVPGEDGGKLPLFLGTPWRLCH